MDTNNLVDPDEIKTIFTGDKVLSKESNITYAEIDESFISKTQEEFQCFMNDFYNLNNKISFNELFGINNDVVDFSKEYISQNSENSLRRGLLEKESDLGSSFKTDKITETLSFYPLAGVLSGLAFELHNNFGHHENEN